MTAILLVLSSCALWFLGLLVLQPYWLLAVIVFSVVIFSLLLSWGGVFLFSRRKKVDAEEKKRIEFQKRSLKKRFDQLWRQQAKSASSPYQVPWHFFIADHCEEEYLLIEQMGFESVDDDAAFSSPIRFWLSDTSVLISISFADQTRDFQEQVVQLLQLIMKKRERQAINGVIATLSISDLLALDDTEVVECSKRYRNFIQLLNNHSGLSLPIYSVFSHMAELTDFCEVFATLDQNVRDKPFGALMPMSSKNAFNNEWFENAFYSFQKTLSDGVIQFLKKKLNSGSRESLVSGLFQINVLRSDLEIFLERTFVEHHYDDKPLFFRGFFFVNAGQKKSVQTDVLTMMHAADLGYETLLKTEAVSSSLSLFSKNLMRKSIIKEARVVGVNKSKETLFRVTKVCVYSGLFCAMAGFLLLIKANFDYQQSLDQTATVLLDKYKENLKSNVIIVDDLSSPIFSIYELRSIYLSYQQPRPWYVTNYLPDSSIEEAVKQAYYNELDSVLLNLMHDYLMKDMFVYSKLDDKVKLLQLLNLYQILFDPNRTDVATLIDFYTNALTEEGEGGELLLSRFKLLANDLLTTSAVPSNNNQALVELVKSSLTSEDMSELLYQHILQHPSFSKRIDFRDKLGPSYLSIFQFKKGFTGYVIPYVFTSEGFHELYTSTGFELASDAIQSYEGVVGRLKGEAEINRINRQLRDRYTEDYIRYWKEFASNVEWVKTNEWGDVKNQLNIASDTIFSPLGYFYNVLDKNTNLEFVEAQKNDAQETPDSTDKDQSDTANRVAASIQAPFVFIHKLVTADEAGKSQLSLALSQMQKTLSWLEQSNDIKSRGRYFLEQLSSTDSNNTLSFLSDMSTGYADVLLPELLQGQANSINTLAMREVKKQLNEDWASVLEFYNQKLKGRYPINRSANEDVSLADFNDFFSATGVTKTFQNKYENYFSQSDNDGLVMKGFLPHQYLIVNKGYLSFITSWQNVRSTLFSKDVPSFTFYIRAEYLSPDLTHLTISGESRLFNYSNGPSLWQKLEWPTPTNVTSEISVELKDTEGGSYVKSVDGIWNWMRLTDLMGSARLPGSDDVSLVYKNKKSTANVRIKSDSEFNALMPGFFSGLTLPDSL